MTKLSATIFETRNKLRSLADQFTFQQFNRHSDAESIRQLNRLVVKWTEPLNKNESSR